jgi:hypothetical protein
MCFFFFFLIYVGCSGQLTRTTIIPHGPLDILQAQEQVRHRGGDRRAYRGSNPGQGWNKSHNWPQQLGPQVQDVFLLHGRVMMVSSELKIKLRLTIVTKFERFTWRFFPRMGWLLKYIYQATILGNVWDCNINYF